MLACQIFYQIKEQHVLCEVCVVIKGYSFSDVGLLQVKKLKVSEKLLLLTPPLD